MSYDAKHGELAQGPQIRLPFSAFVFPRLDVSAILPMVFEGLLEK